MKQWSDEFIESLEPKNKRYTKQKNGLIIRVEPSGKKSWYAYIERGRSNFLGDFPKLNFEQASVASNSVRNSKKNSFNVVILGSGNIGTDLLIKILRSKYLNCVGFIGRSINSAGMKKAISLGVTCSDKSIQYILDNHKEIDLVFDATSADDHKKHAPLLKKLKIKAIDLTPAKVGKMSVPAVNIDDCMNENNINMVTCGGQASIPIAHAIGKTHKDIEYVEVVSSIASKSAGPATRLNLDEYVATTEQGVKYFSGAKKTKAILNLNPAVPCINMQTTVFAKTERPNLKKLKSVLESNVLKIKEYVPGYEIIVDPIYENGRIAVMVRVKGLGDYLPDYAGNLDIINCAAIAMAEEYAKATI